MSVAKLWDEEWSPREEYGRHLELVAPVAPRPLRQGITVSRRRAARARMLSRRRRSMVGLAAVISVVVLAWPGHAFGGVNASGVLTDQTSASKLSSGMVYVVGAHDTLNSIAQAVNPSNPTTARQVLIRELGSSVVVPGEHVLIP